MAGLSRQELTRKGLHMSVGLIAFAVVFLGPLWSAVCALGALLMNLFVLPRIGGRSLWREHESARGMSLGIVLYPFTVLLLILAFWQRLEVAAAVWGILAFGDGMASVVGMAWGRTPLPWNPRKTWLGSAGYWLFGTAGAAVLLWWTVRNPLGTGGREIDLGFVLAVAAVTALFAALVESLPLGLDDNIGVPLLSGLVLFGLLASEGRWAALDVPALGQGALIGGAINLALALVAFRARSVSLSGAIAGFILGVAIYVCAGWQGFLLLMTFFVVGTAATKLGYARKAKAKLAQESGGRRGVKHAVANVGVPAMAAVFALITPYRELYLLAFAGAFATALGDTLGSEIGQLWGRRTYLVTTLKPVPRGTEGAVSLEGTLAGLAGSLLVAAIGWWGGLYPSWGIGVVTVAAFIGTTLESVVGATLEKRGLLDNEAVNFLNTPDRRVGRSRSRGLASSVDPMSQSRAYLKLARPFTMLPPLLGIVSGAVCAFGSAHNPDTSYRVTGWVIITVALGSLCAATMNAASNALNQIYDLEIDRLNKPERPLVTGRLSVPQAWRFTWVVYALSLLPTWLVVVFPYSTWGEKLRAPLALHETFFIYLAGLVFTFIYSVPALGRTKARGVLANITMAIPRGVLLKVAGWAMVARIWHAEPWFIGGVFGLFVFGAASTKDFADIEGDRAGGCKTLPILHGVTKAAWMISPFFVLPWLLIPLGVFLPDPQAPEHAILTGNGTVLLGLSAVMAVWGMYTVYLLLRDPDELATVENHPSWTHMYMMMMLAQVGFAIAYVV